MAASTALTDYGKHYGVVDVESFRNKLPIVDYEALEPWLEQQRKTESQAIVPGRVLLYEKTSGSSGPCKVHSLQSGDSLVFYADVFTLGF